MVPFLLERQAAVAQRPPAMCRSWRAGCLLDPGFSPPCACYKLLWILPAGHLLQEVYVLKQRPVPIPLFNCISH